MASEGGTSYQERQEDELQVLRSIYEDDVEDLRVKAAWNTWQPVKMKLKLSPQESQGPHSQVFAQMDMIITCSPRYPDDVPTIELQNPKSVPERKLKELKQDLMELAKQSVGEVMVMDLAEKVREFLHTYNKPPAKSFHEQMMDKHRREEEERIRKLKEKQERERCKREEEMRQVEAVRRQREQELIEERNETRSKKGVTPPLGEEGSQSPPKYSSSWTSTIISPIASSHVTGPVESPEFVTPVGPAPTAAQRKGRLTSTPRRCSESDADEVDGRSKGNAVCTLVFSKGQGERIVQRGKQQPSQGGGGSTVYCGLDQSTGDTVAILEWVFKWRTVAKKSHFRLAELDEDKEGLAYLKQVKSIEQEANALLRLSHPNIIRYLGFRYHREPGRIIVHMLTEYCGGTNLDWNLRNHKPVAIETLRQQTQGMLQALQYLHDYAVVHKLFRASCVFVDYQETVRLGDYALDKRLRELFREIDTAHSRVKFEDSTDRMPPTLGRGSKKGDIYQLGVTVLALSLGDYIAETVPEIPNTLHPALIDFLNKCLIRDERQRWSASQLLEHQFLKEPLSVLLSPPSPGKDGTTRQGTEDERDESDDDLDLYRTSMERSGKSRLTQEFHVEKTLGKGGFGDVLKVKNKLDGQVYAIKRIMINTRSKLLSKKITREVNLLSRLNHENIVRYYNAWMELTDDPAVSDTSSAATLSSKPTPSPPSSPAKPPKTQATKKRKGSLEMFDDVELLAPKVTDDSVEWSINQSLDATTRKSDDDSDDDDDDDDDEDDNGHWGIGGIGASFLRWNEEEEDSVGFEDEDAVSDRGDHQDTQSNSQYVLQTGTPKKSGSDTSNALWLPHALPEEEPPRLRCLYIQMQYCEKSTLRRAIDDGLFRNMERVWRYFREITQGLLYIHEQKMIHRDLKPVNIFLDANDLVKIGDFGLATTDIVKQKTGLGDSTIGAVSHTDPFSSRSGAGSGDGDMTGEVGTALYVSPEMMKGGSKLRYDQKVDIYSLGIIFFEMNFKPLGTSMERYMVLSNLRKEDILFPADFTKDTGLTNQCVLLRQMLSHDPSQRPSSRDLLQSPYLPAVREVEAEFNRRLDEAVENPESQSYRRILTQFFSRSSSTAMDMTYNMDQTRAKLAHNPVKSMLLHDVVKERVERVFKNHGAIRLDTPLLMPRPQQYAAVEHLLPCFLDKSGAVVNLPFDLRLPFARYVAHHGILNLKRYSIERVYRQLKAQSLHPREFMECALDIVTTTKNSLPDAQLLVVVQQVIDQFPVLQGRGYVVCMNHTKLIEAVLLNAGVPEDKVSAVMLTLVTVQTITEDTIRTTLMQHSISLSPAAQSQLKAYLDTEGELGAVSSKLRPLTRQPGTVGSAVKEGLHDLDNIQGIARDLGLKLKVVVSLCLVYNLRQHSGLIFQVYYKKQHKKQKTREINETLASGGRYDKLVSEFSPSLLEQRAVGVSIAFDILLSALAHETELQMPSPCEVMVCTIGHKPMFREKLQIFHTLLEAGFRTDLHYEPLEDIEDLQDKCRSLGIPFMVFLKDTWDREGDVRIKMLDSKVSGPDKRVAVRDLVDTLKKLTPNKIDREAQDLGSIASGNSNSSSSGGGGGGGGSGSSGSGGSRTVELEGAAKSSSGPSLIFTYASKMSSSARRRIELSVKNKAPKFLTGETEVVVAELPEQAIRTIQAFIELNKEDTDFSRSVHELNEKLSRHRKYLQSVMDHIREIRFEKKKQHLFLYGTKDDTLRLLT